MSVPLYILPLIGSFVVIVVVFLTGAFFSREMGVPLGALGAVLGAASIVMIIMVSGPVAWILVAAVLVAVSGLSSLAALGGE